MTVSRAAATHAPTHDDSAFAAAWHSRRLSERAALQARRQALVFVVEASATLFFHAFPAAALWLYGSVARNEVTATSDFDLLVAGLDATEASVAERWWQDRLAAHGLAAVQVDLRRAEALPPAWRELALVGSRCWMSRGKAEAEER